MNNMFKCFLEYVKKEKNMGRYFGLVMLIIVFAILKYGVEVNWEPLKSLSEYVITTKDAHFINELKELALVLYYFPFIMAAIMIIEIVLRPYLPNKKEQSKVCCDHSSQEDSNYKEMSWAMKILNRTLCSAVTSATTFGLVVFPIALSTVIVITAQYGFIHDLSPFLEVGNVLSSIDIQTLNNHFKSVVYVSVILAVFWFILFARDFYRGNIHQRIYIDFRAQ